MKYSKIRNVKDLHIAHPNQDAGIDFFVPKFDKEFVIQFLDSNKQNTCIQFYLNDQCFDEVYKLDVFQKYSHTRPIFKKQGTFSKFVILPHERMLIPSGIKVNVPERFALIGFNKSGVASKKGLVMGGCVVDHNYQGEIYISLINTSDKKVQIHQDQKIVQFLLLPVHNYGIDIVQLNELYSNQSERNNGAFGSTN